MDDENNGGFTPENEDDIQPDTPRRRMGFPQLVFTGFFLLAAAATVAGLLLTRAPDEAEPVEEALETSSPEPTPVIEPAADVDMEAEPEPAPSPSPETVYVKTALVADGKVIGVLASREAAEELLGEVTSYYAELTGSYDAEVSFKYDITFENAAEDAVPTGHDELLAEFLSDTPPVDVIAIISAEITEPIPYKTVTQNDKYLVKGTRIVVNYGVEGEQTLTTERKYVNGELQRADDGKAAVTKEPVDELIRVGIQKVNSASPNAQQGKKGPDTALTFLPPVPGKIKKNFGQDHGVMHLGLDYAASEGDSVYASCSGTVVCVMERGGYGLVVEIDHGGGFLTRYAQLQSALVKVGDLVSAGDEIAKAGMSGNAEAAHLHFEIRIDGEAYNPRYYID